MISCLVAKDGRVYAKDGVHSHTKIAIACGVNEDQCLKYEFRLETRTLFQDFRMDGAPFEAKQSHDQAAQRFFDECAGTPERLIAYVKRGNWDRCVLLDLLAFSVRTKCDKVCDAAGAKCDMVCDAAEAKCDKVCDAAEAKCDKVCDAAWVKRNKACAAAVAKYGKVCDATVAKYDKVCLAAGAKCGKVRAAAEAKCGKVCVTEEAKYDKVCSKVWLPLFKDPANRIAIWRK